MRNLLRTLALLCALVLPAVQATTAPTLTLTQQARKADVIVRATLGPSQAVTEGSVNYTVYPLTILETIAGDPATLPQLEGKPALYFLQNLADLPTLQPGQEVVALLYARRLDSPLVGFNQGLYPIVNGQVTSPGGILPATPPPAPPVQDKGVPPLNPPPSTASPTAPATTTSVPAFDPAWTDPAKFREALLAARSTP